LPFCKRVESDGAARSWAPDLLPYLEQENIISSANYDLDTDWWRIQSDYIADPANPGSFIPSTTSVAAPNGITVQKHIEVLMCPSTPIQERTQFKDDGPVGHKIGACGDYFTPEGVHSRILDELPATLPAGSAIPGFPPGTTSTSNVVVSGVLQPFGAGTLPTWTTTIAGDPRIDIVRGKPKYPSLAGVTDGTSNTIILGECAGREDVWRGRSMKPANASRSDANCARARGGAWATNDNTYPIGQRINWCISSASGLAAIPGAMKINNSNEWGHLYYSFHNAGANFTFADGSVRFLSDRIPLWVIASLTTRAGAEALNAADF
jgi:prepilin-type processing-associated H-X9-DG protein